MKWMRFLSVLIGIILAVLLLAGCATATPSPTPTAIPSTPVPGPLTITDDLGHTLVIESVPQRIVTLAPNMTEIVFALGQGDRLVGVSAYSDYPPEAQNIPSVAKDLGLNIELIVSLDPDLVLAAGINNPEDISRLQELGLTVLYLAPGDVQGILDSIQVVGQALVAEAAADTLVSDLEARLDAIEGKVSRASSRPRIYYEIDPTLYTGGPGSFTHELITLAGGENIAAAAALLFPQLSAEEIIAADPQIIIFSHAKYGGTAEEIASRPGWDTITAVQEGRIFPIDPDLVDRPGPRIIAGLEEMARLIHPELFGE